MRSDNRRLIPLCLFGGVFLYALGASLFIREILLPELLPHLHAGGGFFTGGDFVGHYERAIEVYERVLTEGWGSWRLLPVDGTRATAPTLAGAVFALGGPYFAYILVINALIHALSALALYFLMRIAFRSDWPALAAALPFALMPTAAYWYSQLHKDGYFFLGMYLFLAAWVLLISVRRIRAAEFSGIAALFVAGMGAMWVAREYATSVMLGASGLLAGVFLLSEFLRQKGDRLGSRDAALKVTLVALCMVTLTLLVETGYTRVFPAEPSTFAVVSRQGKGVVEGQGGAIVIGPDKVTEHIQYCAGGWERSHVPAVLDAAAAKLIATRDGLYHHTYSGAGSTIDHRICIQNFTDFALFLPRAIHVGFLAPFPNQWFETGVVGGAALRRIAGLEMTFIYAAYALCLIALFRMRREPAVWTIVVFAGAIVVLLGIVMPNVGTLHRFRYGYVMLLVGLGVGWLAQWWLARRGKA